MRAILGFMLMFALTASAATPIGEEPWVEICLGHAQAWVPGRIDTDRLVKPGVSRGFENKIEGADIHLLSRKTSKRGDSTLLRLEFEACKDCTVYLGQGVTLSKGNDEVEICKGVRPQRLKAGERFTLTMRVRSPLGDANRHLKKGLDGDVFHTGKKPKVDEVDPEAVERVETGPPEQLPLPPNK